jgi:hypothetical protein
MKTETSLRLRGDGCPGTDTGSFGSGRRRDYLLAQCARQEPNPYRGHLPDAIAAVAVAAASKDYIGQVGPWTGATNDDYNAFVSRLGRDGIERYIKAVADARAAIARASAYEPDLRRFYAETSGSEFDAALADEIINAIRHALALRKPSKRRRRLPPK